MSKTDAKREHDLKCRPPYFQAIIDGTKTFEVRLDDRGFEVGDELNLMEYVPEEGKFTGRDVVRKVTYILRGFAGLTEGYVVLGLENPPVTTTNLDQAMREVVEAARKMDCRENRRCKGCKWSVVVCNLRQRRLHAALQHLHELEERG